MAGAYETGVYRNIFKECGYSEEEIEKRVKETFETIFYGSEEERFYHEAGADMGYMEDTGCQNGGHVIWNDGVRPDEPETGI